jgi:hypothetical protein
MDLMRGRPLPLHARYLAELVRAWAAGSTQPVRPPRDLDRELFLRRFAVEAAAPTLLSVLHPDALPAGDWDRCHKALNLARQRTTLLLLELERVLPALAEAGCRPIVLKGASLALSVYPQPEDRWFVDLDVLLTRAELSLAYVALERLGYRFAETKCSPQYYEDHHFHRILRSAQGVYLEAHWAVTLPASAYSFDLEALRRDATTIALGRAEVLAPSTLDQVLHGVLQSIAGGFTDLRRILDLHLLDHHLSDNDRVRLAERALAHNLATGVWLQYRLREELAGVAIPAPIADLCVPTARVRLLLENLDVPGGCLTRRLQGHEGYDELLHLLCLPARCRAREVRRFLLPDTGGLLGSGLGPEELRNPLHRLRLMLERARIAARMLEYCTRAGMAPVSWR